ncbi:hypothetical protein BY996DRAFT_6413611 [Phakopsora pachyrhizi]|nr:hypothetical protein BY996DRAFT_6413611 [Phakopsora pachyrhizi]
MSNPSQRTSFDDKPLPPVKESPKAPPPWRTRDKVIHMDKAFESAENTPSSSHFSPNHQTSNQISEHLLPERQPLFLNNLGPVATANPSAPLLYEYSEHSRLSEDLSEYIVQSQEQAISQHLKKVFFADERVVPLEHADSNFASAMDYFLSKAPIKRTLARLRGGQSLHRPVSEKPEPPTNESGGGNHVNIGSSEYTAAANASSNYPSQEIKQELSSFVDQKFSEGTLLPHATGSSCTEGCTECPLVSESHYKHGMGAGFSFESENILKKLETRFALLERCKENENLMQCWSLTKSNFNNCSTRQPLSLLRYSNSRFSLPSPAETVENLSSSALNKGLSLALERKFSKSPCRTPPSRTTASETNLSVPAANFSHLQALSSSGSALSERAFDDSENLSTKGENQNLSRKSRIKRQVSATIDPTQAETNNIEADSIQALQETNVAIQKATSKRLSTLVFQKPVSIHSQTALAELSGKEEKYTYQHCLASSVNQQQILDKLSAPLIEKSSRSPNARISLLTGNGKDDMNSKAFPLQRGRGGRGGRVNSVAAKWAKMAASEKAKLSNVEKSLSKSLRKGNDGSEALKSGASSGVFISNRANFIREREPKAIGRPLSSATTLWLM